MQKNAKVLLHDGKWEDCDADDDPSETCSDIAMVPCNSLWA
jgi:hypothetical protein